MIDHRHHFDDQAAEWDKDPKKIERARHTAQLIVDTVQPQGNERVFEFGAGTGLVSQFLAPRVGALTLADNSHGMREVIANKIEAGMVKSDGVVFLPFVETSSVMASGTGTCLVL